MKPLLQFRQSQQLNLTPELRQSIRFLQLPSAVLDLELRSILERNIALEAVAEDEPVETVELEASDEGDFDDSYPGAGSGERRDALTAGRAAPVDWRTSLHRQIDVAGFDDHCELLARAMVDSIDDDGYLRLELAEVAALAGVTADAAELRSVLRRVQLLEPVGIGARDLAEFLDIQVRALHAADRHAPLALALICEGLDAIAAFDIKALADCTGADERAIVGALELIRSLRARPVGGDELPALPPVIPDVVLRRDRRRWVINVTRGALPTLRVDPGFEQLMSESAECRGHEALKSQLGEARWLLRALAMREESLLKVTRAIVARQRGFFERGLQALVPLTLREIADDIGMHESTVSRLTGGKYLQSPVGTFELKYFFTAQLKTDDGFGCSAQTVRERIRAMIGAEGITEPLSDSSIAALLAADGIQVARRTVGKYREQLGIASAAERAKQNEAVARRAALLSESRSHERVRVSGT